MIEIVIANPQVAVIAPPGQPVKVLTFLDPKSGIRVTVPLDTLIAQDVARQLAGGVLVSSIPLSKPPVPEAS